MSQPVPQEFDAIPKASVANNVSRWAWLWVDAVLNGRDSVMVGKRHVDVNELGRAVRAELTESPAIETQALLGVDFGALTIDQPGAVDRVSSLAAEATVLTQAFLYGASELDPEILRRAADPELNLQLLQSPPDHLHELFVVLAAAEVAVSDARRQLHGVASDEPTLKIGLPTEWWKIHRGEPSTRRILHLLQSRDVANSVQPLDAPVLPQERLAYLAGVRERLTSQHSLNFQPGTSRDAEVLDLLFLQRELERPEWRPETPALSVDSSIAREVQGKTKRSPQELRFHILVGVTEAGILIGGGSAIGFVPSTDVWAALRDTLVAGWMFGGLGATAAAITSAVRLRRTVRRNDSSLRSKRQARQLDPRVVFYDRSHALGREQQAGQVAPAPAPAPAPAISPEHAPAVLPRQGLRELQDQVVEIIARQCFADDIALDRSPHLLDRSAEFRAEARRLMLGEAVTPGTASLWPAYRTAVASVERDRVNGHAFDLEELPGDTQQTLIRLSVTRHAAARTERRLEQGVAQPDAKVTEPNTGMRLG